MGSLTTLLSFTLFLAFFTLHNVHGNSELRALMEVKAALDPENKFLKSWTSNGDPCSGSFEGVACNEHRKVANISLQGKGLSGTLSPALAQLECLSGLFLHYNSLSGIIPVEITSLIELSDLYLNVNNLSGTIPPQISNMSSLQVLELCCNQLRGIIPTEIGALKKLNVLALQNNELTYQIPATLGRLEALKRLDLGFNNLSGTIPVTISDIQQLELLDVRNNSLAGVVPSGFKRLNEGFLFENNPGLCGVGFSLLRACGPFDDMSINQLDFGPSVNRTPPTEQVSDYPVLRARCDNARCSSSWKIRQVSIVVGVITASLTLMAAGFFLVFRYRRRKQRIGNTSESSDARLSTDQAKDFHRAGASPLACLEYKNGWDPLSASRNGFRYTEESLNSFRFNLEEIESATQCFSEVNLLGKSKFSSVYKGILRDGSVVAIRSINVSSCKSEEADFIGGLDLLTSLRHENIVRLRGFCASVSRGECFLIYDFASKGNLSDYLDLEDGSNRILDWSNRVSIINGIANGIAYLHYDETAKPAIIHRSLSVDKILLDQQWKPLIADAGLTKLLEDDVVFSALKISAAMGYLAPEYVTSGSFTEKGDMYAFGVIVLQILSGRQMLSNSTHQAAASCTYEKFIDPSLEGNFSESEVAKLAEIAVACTQEFPEDRPTMEEVIQELQQRRNLSERAGANF